jgi:hypothetical protein
MDESLDSETGILDGEPSRRDRNRGDGRRGSARVPHRQQAAGAFVHPEESPRMAVSRNMRSKRLECRYVSITSTFAMLAITHVGPLEGESWHNLGDSDNKTE